jgi:predicted DNA-binding protein (UPF0251 family)
MTNPVDRLPFTEHYLFIINSTPLVTMKVDSEEVVRILLSEREGLAVHDISQRLGQRVSQPTLWRALDKLRSEGRVVVQGHARATRYHSTERTNIGALRSRRLHQIAAQRIARDPSLRSIALKRLHMLRQVNPHGAKYHSQWAQLLEGSLASLLRTMTESSATADTLRKASPFSILVPEEDRRRVFETTRLA